MDIQKIRDAELYIRLKANSMYQSARPDSVQVLIHANDLVDMANELEKLTTFKSMPDFSTALVDLVNKSSTQELEQLYNQNFVITFNGITTEIPFDAVAYNAIQTAIKNILEEQ